MAAQGGSELDFDFAGATPSSDDQDDFDWASLDESEQPAAAAAKPAVVVAQGPIPFRDPPAPAAAPPSSGSSGALRAAGIRPPAAAPPAVPPVQRAPAAPGSSSSTAPKAPAAGAAATPAPAVPPKPAAAVPPGVSSPAAAAAAASRGATGPPVAAPAAGKPAAAGSAMPAKPGAVIAAAGTGAGTAPAAAASAAGAAGPPHASRAAAAAAAPCAEPSSASSAAPAASAASSSNSAVRGSAGGGWGVGGWGLGGLSSKLQQVALGAAKDLQELTASVQQAVAEVVAADDVSELDKLAAYQEHPSRPPPVPASGAAAAAPPVAVTATRDGSGVSLASLAGPSGAAAGADSTPTRSAAGAAGTNRAPGSAGSGGGVADEEELRRREVLQRLQGSDTQLESGLKAIDEQVDLLAVSAAHALGSIWGGLNKVAKTSWTVGAAITTKVEAAAKEVAKELVVGLEEGVTAVAQPVSVSALREAAGQLAARAEKGLESVGRGAATLLDPQFASGRPSSSVGGSMGQQRSPSDWAATFDSCFELYGGAQAAEELEQLSSECAHICNRARAKLQQEHREQIDATLTQLVPAFDLNSSSSAQQQQQAADAEQEQEQDDYEQMHEALGQMYLPVVALCNKGKYKVSQLQQEAATAAADAAAADACAAAGEAGRRTDATSEAAAAAASLQEIQPEAGSGDDGEDGNTAGGDSSGDSTSSKVDELLQRLLAGLRSAAVKSLAEVSAGQLMLLLSLGRSVAALSRYGKPLGDGLMWPAEPDQVAALMRQQVQLMMGDIQNLAGTFAAAAPAIVEALSTAAAAAGAAGLSKLSSSEAAQQQAKAAAAEVDVDCNVAMGYVRDGFGKLLYVVLLTSLHRAGLQPAAAPQQQGKVQQQQQPEEGAVQLVDGVQE